MREGQTTDRSASGSQLRLCWGKGTAPFSGEKGAVPFPSGSLKHDEAPLDSEIATPEGNKVHSGSHFLT